MSLGNATTSGAAAKANDNAGDSMKENVDNEEEEEDDDDVPGRNYGNHGKGKGLMSSGNALPLPCKNH